MLIELDISFLTMLHFQIPIVGLLALLSVVNGQYNDCDYAQRMVPGQKYYAFNREYPQNYRPGTTCRWVLTSDSPININCDPIDLPSSSGCTKNFLEVRAGQESEGHRYCGKGKFSKTVNSTSLTIILKSSRSSPGGKFLCTLISNTETENPNCKCGWKNPKKIVGGVETGVNEFPMMAGLVDVGKRIIMCGATIINEKQVMTAAHCVAGRASREIGVIVGEHDTSTGLETNATKLLAVEALLIHYGYDSESDIIDNDIALVTVDGAIEFNQRVGPACLPFKHNTDSFSGDYVEILGWGFTQFSAGKSKTLQKAGVTVITTRQCKQTYPEVTDKQICTYDSTKDSCQFDSGGPVLWTDPTSRKLVGVGIISLGSYCGNGDPAQNTRVGAYIDWIVKNTYKGIQYCKSE